MNTGIVLLCASENSNEVLSTTKKDFSIVCLICEICFVTFNGFEMWMKKNVFAIILQPRHDLDCLHNVENNWLKDIKRVSIWEKIKMSEKYTSNMPTEEKEIAQPVAWSQLQIWNVSIYFEREKRKLNRV